MSKQSPKLPSLSWREVCARRLERHRLATPARDAQPADIVRAMGGAHAQVMSAAEVSIALRLAGATRETVRHALWHERSLVKTRGPRGTVHLLPTVDLPLWTGALSSLPPARAALPEGVQMTPDQTEAVIQAMTQVLAEAELTTDELTEAIVAVAGPWAGEPVMEAFQGKWPRWRQIEDLAMNRGVLCFGPNRGQKVTYTSPRRWQPDFKSAEGKAALAWLVQQYLHAYGPATAAHFAQWLNVPRRWATDLFDSFRDELQPVEVEGTPAWVVAGDDGFPADAATGVRLLPYFDAYVVGCHPREQLFPGPAAKRALAGGQAGPFPVLLIDGIVAGVWHQRRAGRKLAITVEPLGDLTKAQQRMLDDQVARIGEILDGTPQLMIGKVTVGAHA
jgi:hypothetical protein